MGKGVIYAPARAMTWAWDQAVSHSEKLVLLALAGYVNPDFECFPSQTTIARQTGLARPSVSRAIKMLINKGLVSTLKVAGRGSLLYTLNVEKGVTQDDTPPPVTQDDTVTDDDRGVSPTMTPPVTQDDTEGLMEGTSKKETLAPATRTRKRDLLFEALVEETGLRLDSLTKSERGRVNKAAKELREVGATPDDVRDRAKLYKLKYPNVAITATALAGNWGQLASARPRRNHSAPEQCPNCGVIEEHHQVFIHCGR